MSTYHKCVCGRVYLEIHGRMVMVETVKSSTGLCQQCHNGTRRWWDDRPTPGVG